MGRRVTGRGTSAAVALAATLSMGAFTACYPGGISDISQADLVITAYDTTYAFAPGTFALPDSIVRVGDGDEEDIDRTYDQQILDAVAAQFTALGYTRVEPDAIVPPDFVVTVGVSSSTYNWWVPGGGWWGWWGWYPGWGGWYPGWGPGYGPGYPWYPGYGGSYTTGSLFVGMIDTTPSVGPELNAVWGGIINGLLSSSNETTAARVLDLIDQVFEQSPYLGATPSPAE